MHERPSQLPLFRLGPTIWDQQHRGATWQEVARALPAGLGLELRLGESEWRIVHIPAATRRALEELDVAEGEVIPVAARIEAARRRAHAEDLLAQARAVLRAMQVDNEVAC